MCVGEQSRQQPTRQNVGFIGAVALFTFPHPRPRRHRLPAPRSFRCNHNHGCCIVSPFAPSPRFRPSSLQGIPVTRRAPPLEFIGGKRSSLGCSFPEVPPKSVRRLICRVGQGADQGTRRDGFGTLPRLQGGGTARDPARSLLICRPSQSRIDVVQTTGFLVGIPESEDVFVAYTMHFTLLPRMVRAR